MTGHATGHLRTVIAANIVAAMAERELSAADLMRETEFHERAIRRWRRGEVSPSLTNMEVLAAKLGHPVEWFYTDHGYESQANGAAA